MSPLEKGKLDARTAVLGVLALACVGTLAAKNLKREPSDVEAVAATRGPRPTGVAIVGSSGSAGDRAALEKLYKPIVDADPFKARSFKRKPPEARPDKARPPEKTPDDKPAAPETPMIALRLTGVFTTGEQLGAFLENRTDGKALFVRPGDRFGSHAIASVHTDSIVLTVLASTAAVGTRGGVAKVETRTVALGDKVDMVAADLAGKFSDLTVAKPASTGGTSAGGSGKVEPKPVLSEEKKNDILERLKNKRKQSLGGEPK